MNERNNPALRGDALTRRQIIFGAAVAFGGLTLGSSAARAAEDELSRTAESIHEEVTFNATPARVYEILTVAAQFEKVVKLSAAMQSGMAPAKKSAMLRGAPGGAFSLFGGYVTGRNIELVPAKRVVQAWRAASWPAGVYSIVKFELSPDSSGTKLVFDQAGFPQDDAAHLVPGWYDNYWKPMARVLATP
ncbi:MAG TPA: SRPBCC domain-containing protein [Candidatus Acidoferrales bacterium]|nr:SRPBCC domain-containing protein [Candidatus Acidoferrales bacterium]